MLVAEPFAGSAEAADHFVDDQQQAVLLADFGQGFVVAFGRHDDAAASGDGLDDHGTHGVRIFLLHHGFKLAGEFFAQVGGAGGVGRTVFGAGREFHEAGGEGAVLVLAFFLAAGAQRGDGGAVVVAVAVDDLVFLAAVLELGNLADDLEGLFIGFGTGVGKIHAAHAGHLLNQFFGELDGGDVAEAVGKVAELHELVAHGLDQGFVAVTEVDRPDAAGNGIQILFAVDVLDPHALAFDKNSGIGFFKDFVLGEVMPDVFFVVGDQFSGIKGLGHDFLQRKGFRNGCLPLRDAAKKGDGQLNTPAAMRPGTPLAGISARLCRRGRNRLRRSSCSRGREEP